MGHRTAVCRDCASTFDLNPVGRPSVRCIACRRGQDTCETCHVVVKHVVQLPGVGTLCRECSPTGGVVRTFKCGRCSARFVRKHRGGGTSIRAKKWLCDDCESSHKQCAACTEILPGTEFYPHKRKRFGWGDECRPCVALRNSDPLVRQHNQAKHLASTYGVTLHWYSEQGDKQGWRCLICERRRDECPDMTLVVDHDHSHCANNRGCQDCIRGLLCKTCNFGIGFFQDDASVVDRAAQYLRANAR